MRLVIEVPPAQAPGILAGMVATNLRQIHSASAAGSFPVLDAIRAGKLRYKLDAAEGPEKPYEHWKTWRDLLQPGATGDCNDFAPAVAAEYIAAGIYAEPLAYEVPGGTVDNPLWHVVVVVRPRYRRAWVGDPSRLAGMA